MGETLVSIDTYKLTDVQIGLMDAEFAKPINVSTFSNRRIRIS